MYSNSVECLLEICSECKTRCVATNIASSSSGSSSSGSINDISTRSVSSTWGSPTPTMQMAATVMMF